MVNIELLTTKMAFPTGVWIFFAFAICATTSVMASKTRLTILKQDAGVNQCEEEGYYGNENNCASFYRCVEDMSQVSMDGQKVFKRVNFECPPGTIFDEEIRACNFPERVNPKPGCMQLSEDEEEIGGSRAPPGLKCEPQESSAGSCAGHSGCNFTDPNNVFYQHCSRDCKNNHNAVTGKCTGRDFCTCGPALKSVSKKSIICLDLKDAEVFEALCNADCQCIHNAVGGGCNYYTKSCECGETVAKNAKNQCPYKTINELFHHSIEKYKSIGVDIMEILNGPRQSSV